MTEPFTAFPQVQCSARPCVVDATPRWCSMLTAPPVSMLNRKVLPPERCRQNLVYVLEAHILNTPPYAPADPGAQMQCCLAPLVSLEECRYGLVKQVDSANTSEPGARPLATMHTTTRRVGRHFLSPRPHH